MFFTVTQTSASIKEHWCRALRPGLQTAGVPLSLLRVDGTVAEGDSRCVVTVVDERRHHTVVDSPFHHRLEDAAEH